MTLRSNVIVGFEVAGRPLQWLEKTLDRFGMRMRLTARDLLRLGGTISSYFSRVESIWLRFLRLGDVFAGGMEEVEWVLGDLADVVGEALEPALEFLADILENVVDYAEENPWLQWAIILPLIIALVGKLAAGILRMVGTIKLAAGTLMTWHREALGFVDGIRYVTIALTEGKEAADKWLVTTGKLQRMIAEERDRFFQLREALADKIQVTRQNISFIDKEIASRKRNIAQIDQQINALTGLLGTSPEVIERIEELTAKREKETTALEKLQARRDREVKKLYKYQDQLIEVEGEITSINKLTKEYAKQSKKQEKGVRGVFTTVKKGLKPMAKWAAIGTSLIGLAFGLFLAWEPLQDLFEVVTDILYDLLSPLEPIIESFADWLEENPDLAKALILLILLLPAVFLGMKVLGKVGGILGKVFGKLGDILGKVTSPFGKLEQGTWKTYLAEAALIGAVAALIFSLAYFFTSLMKTGVGLWEAVGALSAVFAAILGFLGGLVLLARGLSTVSSQVWMGIAALAALVGIVTLLTWAFTMLLQPLTQIEGGIAALWNLVGALLALLAGCTILIAVLGALGPLALLGAMAFLMLGAAVLMAGTGFYLAGMGAQLLAQAIGFLIDKLVESISVLPQAVALLFGLGAGLMAVGMGGLVALAGLMAAFMGFTMFSTAIAMTAGALYMLAGAISAVAAALRAVPDWARGIVGGFLGGLASIGRAIGGMFGIPGAQRGGIVERAGIVYVHPGELIVPARVTPEVGGEYHNTFFITAYIRGEEDIRALAEEINKLQAAKIGRTV